MFYGNDSFSTSPSLKYQGIIWDRWLYEWSRSSILEEINVIESKRKLKERREARIS